MRKRIQIFLTINCVIAFCSISRAQYFGIEDAYNNFYVHALGRPYDGKFRVMRTPITIKESGRTILIFDQNKHLIDSVAWPDSIGVSFVTFLRESGRILFPAAIYKTKNHPAAKSGIIETDTNYNIIKYHPVFANDSGHPDIRSIHPYAGGYLLPVVRSYPNNYVSRIYKTDKQFNIVDSSLAINDISFWSECGPLYNNKLYLHAISAPAACAGLPSPSAAHCSVFDTTLSLINCFNLDTLKPKFKCGGIFNRIFISQAQRIFPISSTKIFVAGNGLAACSFTAVTHYAVNSFIKEKPGGKDIIKTHVFSDSLYSINHGYSGVLGSWVSVQLPFVYTVFSSGFPYVTWFPDCYYEAGKYKLLVNKMDTMGNVLWVKEFGGEMNYFGASIDVAYDGGFLIAGQRFDSLTMSNPLHFENFLLHLDSAGNIVGTGIFENGTISWNNCRIYPNPVKDEMRVDIPFEKDALIEVFDSNGRLVLSEKHYSTMNSIQIRQLPPGMYSVKIEGGFSNYSGKFLKE